MQGYQISIAILAQDRFVFGAAGLSVASTPPTAAVDRRPAMAKSLIAVGLAVLLVGAAAGEPSCAAEEEDSALLATKVAINKHGAGQNSSSTGCSPMKCEGPVKNANDADCQWMITKGDDCQQASAQSCRQANPGCPCGYYPDASCNGQSYGCQWLNCDDCSQDTDAAKCCRSQNHRPCDTDESAENSTEADRS